MRISREAVTGPELLGTQRNSSAKMVAAASKASWAAAAGSSEERGIFPIPPGKGVDPAMELHISWEGLTQEAELHWSHLLLLPCFFIHIHTAEEGKSGEQQCECPPFPFPSQTMHDLPALSVSLFCWHVNQAAFCLRLGCAQWLVTFCNSHKESYVAGLTVLAASDLKRIGP